MIVSDSHYVMMFIYGSYFESIIGNIFRWSNNPGMIMANLKFFRNLMKQQIVGSYAYHCRDTMQRAVELGKFPAEILSDCLVPQAYAQYSVRLMKLMNNFHQLSGFTRYARPGREQYFITMT